MNTSSPLFWASLNFALAVVMGLTLSPYSAIPNGLVAAFYLALYLRKGS